MQSAPRADGDQSPGDNGPRKGRSLPLAVVTGVALAGILIGTLFWSLPAFTGLVVVAVLVALAELYRVLAERRGLRPAQSVGFAGAVILILGTAWRGTVAFGFGLAVVTVATFLWYLVDARRERVTENVAVTLLGVVYVPLFAAHVVAMAKLPHGPSITMVFFGLAVFYDVGAYASGSAFGRHRMAPRISPAKSWEGAAGATALVFLLAMVVAPLFEGMDRATAAGLAGFVVVMAPIGDLAESVIKRDLGVKDMGGLLPGHGGMLDRIDALLFVAPFAYWYLRAVTG